MVERPITPEHLPHDLRAEIFAMFKRSTKCDTPPQNREQMTFWVK